MAESKPSGDKAHAMNPDAVAAFNEAVEMAAALVEGKATKHLFCWQYSSWRRQVKVACNNQRRQLAANIRHLKRKPPP